MTSTVIPGGARIIPHILLNRMAGQLAEVIFSVPGTLQAGGGARIQAQAVWPHALSADVPDGDESQKRGPNWLF